MRLLKILAVAWLFGIPAQAADNPVTTFTLENGMEAVVIEDHRAPVVTHMVWYRAGAADEPPGKSGIAHLLEHLMFKRTETLDAGEFSRIVSRNGGRDNAFTSYDYTGYFQRISADRLDLVMGLEADRMVNLVLTEEDFQTERLVVLEERAQRTDNSPAGLFREQRNAALYLNHPYGIPIIGWRHEIEALTLQDALDWYETYYAPNNAVLVVAGDVTPDEVKALAEKHYGPIAPSSTLPERIRPSEPPHLSERRLTYHDERVRQPYVVRTYLAPERNSGDQRQAAAVAILAELIGVGGITSELGQTLQLDEKVALSTGASFGSVGLDRLGFALIVVPAPGVSLAEAEDGMDRVLQRFAHAGPNQDQLERIKMQIRASQIYARDSQQSLARRYGAALTSGLTVEDVQAWPDILQSITADEIRDAAQAVFIPENSVTGWLMGTPVAEEVTE